MNALANVLVAALFILLPTLIALTSIAAHTLKGRYPAVWQAEGEPERWLWLQPARPSQHIFGFLDERRYLATGSARYARLCAVVRLGWYAFFILFVVTLVAMGVTVLGTAGTAA